MSSNNVSTKEVSVDAQGLEPADAEAVDEPLRPRVELQTQAKVDANHPDVGLSGLTLAAEEQALAREAEKTRTRKRWDRRQSSDREARTRQAAAQGRRKQRDTFARRRASVDPWADPEREDPRAGLSKDELATVNQEARRIAATTEGWTAAAVSNQLARCVADGDDVMTAVIRVSERVQEAPGTIVPIGKLEDITRKVVSVQGCVVQLWDSSSPAISQVGLIEDDSGKTKLTSWTASGAPWIEEGERVHIHGAAKNWYEGRVSLAVTGWTTIHFPERGWWWEA